MILAVMPPGRSTDCRRLREGVIPGRSLHRVAVRILVSALSWLHANGANGIGPSSFSYGYPESEPRGPYKW